MSNIMPSLLAEVNLLAPYILLAGLCIAAVISLCFSLNSSKPKVWRHITALFSVLLFISLCVLLSGFTIDDTYISLRYARNLANGHGLTYTIGTERPVEGYTNFLWIILEAPLFLIGINDASILHAVKLMGIAFGIGSIVVTRRLACQVGLSETAGLIAMLFVSSVPFLAFWSIGGLETSMYIFFALAAVSALLGEHESAKRHVLSYLLLTCMALTRPEGLFFSLVITPIVLVVLLPASRENASWHIRLRALVPGVVLFLVLYGTYFFWRWNYY